MHRKAEGRCTPDNWFQRRPAPARSIRRWLTAPAWALRGIQFVTDSPQQLAAPRQGVARTSTPTRIFIQTGPTESPADRPVLHDDQLLPMASTAPCWSAVPPGIHQLLLISWLMAANRQRRQQDAVLTMRIRQPPLQRCSAIRQRQIAWTEVAALSSQSSEWQVNLVMIFSSQTCTSISQQRQPQAIQYRRNAFAWARGSRRLACHKSEDPAPAPVRQSSRTRSSTA